MERKIIVTGDKSKSLLIPGLDETYHSIHGAKNESQHIFIAQGLMHQLHTKEVKIFEMGFGTGLNALLTVAASKGKNTPIIYDTIEKYPLTPEEVAEIDHPNTTGLVDLTDVFNQMHNTPWEVPVELSPLFTFTKFRGDVLTHPFKPDFYTLIYYDAFAPKIQPDLWAPELMQKLYNSLSKGGMLLTYCSQGQFRRNLLAAGFSVERKPGPAGKREITCAIK